ncbi:hypothetical protein OWV82_006561 [Melia azedarach]|uniref:Uncharacterized protein n=1 Tax=Melia azedarach TaxID=155640 RepID=A0ACC1YI90_MELAZ|nr:hypothetical protein OWV82_006561 [Melia azedarach]
MGLDTHGRERMKKSSSKSSSINESVLRDGIRAEVHKEYESVIDDLKAKYDELYAELQSIRTHFQSCKCGCQINMVRNEQVGDTSSAHHGHHMAFNADTQVDSPSQENHP